VKPDLWISASTPAGPREDLARLANLHDFPISGALPDRLGHADMLVSAHDVAAALEAIPRLDGLRVVQTFSAGVDSIVGRLPPGVVLCDASGVHDVSVAEWIMMAILASNRGLPPLVDAQRTATWRRDHTTGEDLEGARVLIVGYGSIGKALEARLTPFGAEIVRVARHERDGVHAMADLAGLLPSADVIVILLPLTPDTRGLIGADVLRRVRPGALLVNASRGAVVDTPGLMSAVVEGGIRAALDVTDPEPLPDGHPLWSMPGVLITPHVAGDVRHEEERAWRLVADQVARLARREPLRNVVTDGY
jgi:phosphoglycerate dehydrogenase-like enzyme